MAVDMDYLECIRFLFDAEQDTDLHVFEDLTSIDIQDKILKMAAEAVEANLDDYLEDIRFLFDAEQDSDLASIDIRAKIPKMAADMDDYLEDIRFLFDTSSLDEDKTTAGDAKGAKWLKGVAQRLKKMKKGVQKFCSRLGKTVRRGFCCRVSVEE